MNGTASNGTAANATALSGTALSGTAANSTVGVRRAVPGDRAALARMYARCTGRTGYERFHGYVNAIPDRYLTEALSGSPVHYALVACADGDRADGDQDLADGGVIVALASCRAVAEGVAELGVLIEDRWQRRGLGARLLRELIGHADREGFRVLQAQILSEQAWIISLLRRYGTCHAARGGYGTMGVTLRLSQASPPDHRHSAQPALGSNSPGHIMTNRTRNGAT